MGTTPPTRRRKILDSGTSLQISAAAVADSEDLLIEIFMCIPVKPLVRFKLVSQQWRSLISDPKFIVNHARRNPSLNALLLKSQSKEHPPLSIVPFEGYEIPRTPPLQFLNKPGIDILHSCKGFLCYSVVHDLLTSYYVCHSASGRSARIRVFDQESVKALRSVCVAFDPLKSVHYKVIFVRQMSGSQMNRLIKIEIYSSETRCWKSVKEILIVPNNVEFENEGVYWNGAVYWYEDTRLEVLYFDLELECFKKLPTPQVSEDSPKMNLEYFGESCGRLHLITTRRSLRTQFTVYEMQRDKSDWIVKYQGDLNSMTLKYPKMVRGHIYRYYVYRPLCLIEGEKNEEPHLVIAIPGKVILYNLEDKGLKMLCDLLPAKSFCAHAISTNQFRTFQYMETLASI